MSEHFCELVFDRGGKVELTTFGGGLKHGMCLQLDLEKAGDFVFVQLHRDEVIELKRTLEHWLVDSSTLIDSDVPERGGE